MALVAGTYGGVPLNATQVMYANTIIQVGQQRNIPARGIVIALMTAKQESNMGLAGMTQATDHDSLGLFQQRPSQGWGTPAQVMNSVYATNKFYDTLLKVPGWQAMGLSAAAQAVQRSAFPSAYAKWQPMAEAALNAAGVVTGPLQGPAVGSGAGGAALPPIDVSGLAAISDPAMWKKIGWFLLGVVLFAIGALKLFSSTPLGDVAKKVGKAVVLKKVPV